MSIVVTGGAGFIGSCMVRTLNDNGIDDIIIVDNIASTEKWRNIRNKKYREYVQKEKFLEKLLGGGVQRCFRSHTLRGMFFHYGTGF